MSTIAPPAGASSAPHNPTLVALIVAGAFFMEILDATIIAPAIPQMAASFGSTAVAVSTGISSYLITVAIFIPASAWLSDRFGARNVFTFAITVFTIASVLCGLSETLTQFTGARILQGIGGAMMSPVGRIEVMKRTEKSQLLRTIAFLTWPGLTAFLVGPPLGGLLTTYLDWRWIFFINVPIGLVGIGMVLTFFPRPVETRRRPFDALGLILNGGALSTLIYGIETISRNEPLALTATFLGLGVTLGFLAIRHAKRTASPLLTLAPFSIRTFAIGTLWGGSLFRLAASGTGFILPVMFQVGFGLSAFTAGLLLSSYLAGDLAAKTVANKIIRRVGFRTTLIGGSLVVAAVSCLLLVITPQTPLGLIVALLVVIGGTRSVQFTALNSLIFADLPADQVPSASALNSMSHQVASGIGVGIAAVVLAVSSQLRGGGGAVLTMFDFRVALGFAIVLVLLTLVSYHTMPHDTGSHVSGHKPRLKTAA